MMVGVGGRGGLEKFTEPPTASTLGAIDQPWNKGKGKNLEMRSKLTEGDSTLDEGPIPAEG